MSGEVWIIGASKGLGLEMARVFARRGRKVVGFARRPPAGPAAFDAFHPARRRTTADALDARVQPSATSNAPRRS